MNFPIVLPVGWPCPSLYFYQLYFLSIVLTLEYLFTFHPDLLLNIQETFVPEEKSRFALLWLIPISEPVNYSFV